MTTPNEWKTPKDWSGPIDTLFPQSYALMDELRFLHWLIDECGYKNPRPIGSGCYAAIAPMAYTHAIITGRIGDRCSLTERWCYESYADALKALDAWNGLGEPQGWHRHPATGRRVSRSPDERGADGKLVGAIGVPYVRP